MITLKSITNGTAEARLAGDRMGSVRLTVVAGYLQQADVTLGPAEARALAEWILSSAPRATPEGNGA